MDLKYECILVSAMVHQSQELKLLLSNKREKVVLNEKNNKLSVLSFTNTDVW